MEDPSAKEDVCIEEGSSVDEDGSCAEEVTSTIDEGSCNVMVSWTGVGPRSEDSSVDDIC